MSVRRDYQPAWEFVVDLAGTVCSYYADVAGRFTGN